LSAFSWNLTRRLAIAVLIGWATVQWPHAAAEDIADCETELKPVQTEALLQPWQESIRGRATLAVIVDTAGRVRQPVLLSSWWWGVARQNLRKDYDATAVLAVRQFRYPPQPTQCRTLVSVEFDPFDGYNWTREPWQTIGD
jgi:uncharacterized protein YfaS (alpha-2-macroglobulin family)